MLFGAMIVGYSGIMLTRFIDEYAVFAGLGIGEMTETPTGSAPGGGSGALARAGGSHTRKLAEQTAEKIEMRII